MSPEYRRMFARLCRYYQGYTLDRVADELDFAQIRMLLADACEEPYDYVVMVEPK